MPFSIGHKDNLSNNLLNFVNLFIVEQIIGEEE